MFLLHISRALSRFAVYLNIPNVRVNLVLIYMKYKIHFMPINFNICMVNVKTLKYIVFNLRYDLFPLFHLISLSFWKICYRETFYFVTYKIHNSIKPYTQQTHSSHTAHTHNCVLKNEEENSGVKQQCLRLFYLKTECPQPLPSFTQTNLVKESTRHHQQ